MDLAIILSACLRLASGDADWDTFQKKTEVRYQEWSKDHNDGSYKQFLDDKLITMDDPDTMERLKNMVHWLALYKKANEPLPEVAQKILNKIQDRLQKFDADKVTYEDILHEIIKIEKEIADARDKKTTSGARVVIVTK